MQAEMPSYCEGLNVAGPCVFVVYFFPSLYALNSYFIEIVWNRKNFTTEDASINLLCNAISKDHKTFNMKHSNL